MESSLPCNDISSPTLPGIGVGGGKATHPEMGYGTTADKRVGGDEFGTRGPTRSSRMADYTTARKRKQASASSKQASSKHAQQAQQAAASKKRKRKQASKRKQPALSEEN